MKTISDRLNFLRGYLKLSQPEMATKFGIPYNSYIKYEHGSSKPGSEAIEGIARAGINTNWLLTGDGPIHLCDLLSGEGQILPSEMGKLRVNKPVAQYAVTKDHAGMEAMNMASLGGTSGSGLEIDENMLKTCHDACRGVHGMAFDEIPAVAQLGYATDLYNLLVKMSAQNGGLDKMKCLESTGMVELLNVFIRLGWAKKFPPPPLDTRRDNFF